MKSKQDHELGIVSPFQPLPAAQLGLVMKSLCGSMLTQVGSSKPRFVKSAQAPVKPTAMTKKNAITLQTKDISPSMLDRRTRRFIECTS